MISTSAAIGGPGFKPEASQLFLPKWSRHYRKGRSGSQTMVRGRISDWVVHPVFEAARPCPRPEDGTSEDPTAEDCTPEDCTCEGCTAQVCPQEDCTSKDNTSEDRSAEDPDRWTVHGCSGPPATRRAGLRHGASFCHAAHSLREAVDSPGILGSYPSVLRWQVGVIPGPSSRIQALVSNN